MCSRFVRLSVSVCLSWLGQQAAIDRAGARASLADDTSQVARISYRRPAIRRDDYAQAALIH